MTSASASLAALATILASTCWVRTAAASGASSATPATVAARLEVHAAEDCTTQNDIAARVVVRSPGVRFTNDASGLTFRAEVTATRAGGVAGELVIAGPGSKASTRRIAARSCTEVADAVALIIAVALDSTSPSETEAAYEGMAMSGDAGSPPPTPGSSPAAVPAPAAVAAPSQGATERPDSSAPRGTSSTANPSDSSSPGSFDGARRRFGLDVELGSWFGPAPSVMPGVTVLAMAAIERDALWSPALIVGATHAWTSGQAEPGGTASFTLDVASLDACALAVRIPAVTARACGSASVGLMSASGTETRSPAAFVRPFVVAGATIHVTANLGSIFVLSARLMAGITPIRDSYEFTPVVFYQAAPMTASASLGFGARWR